MGEILGLGLTHYPPLSWNDEHMGDIFRLTLTAPNVPDAVKDRATWPAEAIRELRETPWIYRLLAARAMQEAHSAVVRWENTSPKAKEDTEPPSGPWVERVARYMTEDVRGEVEARKRAAERLKR